MSLTRPSDPPPAFVEDRRGKAPRTQTDYAELAACYLAALPSERRKLASRWAREFGRSPQRWRMDLARANQFIETVDSTNTTRRPTLGVLRLTTEGEKLVYGGPLSEAERAETQLSSWLAVMDGASEAGRAAWVSRIKHEAGQSGARTQAERNAAVRERISLAQAMLRDAEQSLYS